jgi:recombinational DNA repair protein RecT
MKRLLITLLLTLITTQASATVQRGKFTSSGAYIMPYQQNDHLQQQYSGYVHPQYRVPQAACVGCAF